MNELVKALEKFIVRDLIYIIGGASVYLVFYIFLMTHILRKNLLPSPQ